MFWEAKFMNDEALETYLNIIKTHSLTKTAENMFISQSAVSNRLVSLEKELNVKLIDRSPGQKGVVLTQKGEEFVEFAKRHQELNRQIQDWSRGDVTEVLRVASVISLTDYVKGFYRELLGKGKLSITLATHWTDRIISMLENRETDIGITPRVFYSKAVEAVPIFREPLFLLSSKSVSDYPEVVQAQQLKRSNEIYFDWGTGFVEWHEKQMNPLDLPLMVTDTTELIPELLRIPDSFSIIPACIFKNYYDTELRLSRIVPEPPPRICYLLKLRELHSQKKELIEQFEKEFKEYIRTVEDVISI